MLMLMMMMMIMMMMLMMMIDAHFFRRFRYQSQGPSAPWGPG